MNNTIKKLLKLISPGKNLTLFIVFLVYTLFVFSLFRLIFFLKYKTYFTGISITQIAYSFIAGIRFDLSTIMILTGLVFVILHLLLLIKENERFYKYTLFLIYVIFFPAIFIMFVDIYYYQYSGRRLSFEIYTIIDDLSPMFNTIIKNYLIGLILFFIFFFAYCTGLYFITRPVINQNTKSGFTKKLIYFLIFVIFLVISIRGGFQLKPLRPSYAFRNNNIYLGHLSLNGIYTVLNTLKKGREGPIYFIPEKEAITTIHKILSQKDESWIDAKFPLLRQINRNKPAKKLNVVLLIMESWSAKEIGIIGGNANNTPFFDNISKDGVLFTNFFATGLRSVEGIASIICSMPSFPNLTLIGGTLEQNVLRSLCHILKEYGYQSVFIHGARLGSFGLDAFAKLNGFDRYISKQDFNLTLAKDDGTWGIYDEYSLSRCNEEFNKMKEPFLGVYFSLTTHDPFTLPSPDFQYFNTSVPNYKYLNTLRYSDWCLSKFFKEAKKYSYFKNTLFIITADHTIGKYLTSIYNLFHIPCLFYCPEYLKPKKIDTVSGQLDIVPSILDILNLSTKHSCFGKSSLNSRNTFAIASHGDVNLWFRNDFVLLNSDGKNIGLYNFKNDKEMKTNIINNNAELSKLMRNELLSFTEISQKAIIDNLIYPIK